MSSTDHSASTDAVPSSRLRSLLTQSRSLRAIAGNIGVSVFTQVFLLISGVAGARILGVLDRGRSALLLLFATVIPLVLCFGFPLALTYWLARDERLGRALLRRSRRTVGAQVVAVVTVQAIVLFIVFRHDPTPIQVAAAISLLGGPSIMLFYYGLAILQGLQEFSTLNRCMLFFPPLNALCLFGLLVSGEHALWMVTVVWTVLYFISGLITTGAGLRAVRRRPDTPQEPVPSLGEMTRFGLKAQFGSLSPLTGFNLDQAIVGLFISQAALGIYSVAVAFTNLPQFVAQSIGLVAYPHVAADRGAQRLRTIARFVVMALVLCGGIAIAIEVVLPFIVPRLYGNAFRSATGVARILLISSVCFCLTRVLSDSARGMNRPGLGTIAEFVSLVAMFPLVILLHHHGAKGVAVALAGAAAAGTIVMAIGLLIPARGTQPDPIAGAQDEQPVVVAEGVMAGPDGLIGVPEGDQAAAASAAVATAAAKPRRVRRRTKFGRGRMRPAAPPIGRLASLGIIAFIVLVGAAIGASGAGPEVGALAGLVLIGAVGLLGVSPEKLMFGVVSVFVFTVSWDGIRFAGGSFANIFLVLSIVSVVAACVFDRRLPVVPTWLVIAAITILAAQLIDVIFPVSVALQNRTELGLESLGQINGYIAPRSNFGDLGQFELGILLMPVMIATAARTRSRCRRLLDFWTIGATINCAFGIVGVGPHPLNGSRAYGLTIHPNYLSLTALMSIPTAMIWIGRSRRWTYAGFAAVAILCGGVFVSGSRDGFISLIVELLITLFAVPRLRRRVTPALPVAIPAVVGVLALLLMLTHLGNQILDQVRLGSSVNSASTAVSSNSQRSYAADIAFAQIGERPLSGVGYAVIADAQNIYLQILAAGGIIGLVGWMTYLGGLAASARRAWRIRPSDEIVAIVAVVVGYLIHGVFDAQLADKYVYVLPGILIALAANRSIDADDEESAGPITSRAEAADAADVPVYA